MENENVRKDLKISQNIWKMLWCIENANTVNSRYNENLDITNKTTGPLKISRYNIISMYLTNFRYNEFFSRSLEVRYIASWLYKHSVKISCTYGHLFKSCTKIQNRFTRKQKTEKLEKFPFFLIFLFFFTAFLKIFIKNTKSNLKFVKEKLF